MHVYVKDSDGITKLNNVKISSLFAIIILCFCNMFTLCSVYPSSLISVYVLFSESFEVRLQLVLGIAQYVQCFLCLVKLRKTCYCIDRPFYDLYKFVP